MRVLILTVLAIFVVASPASAYEYAGQHPLTNQKTLIVQSALKVGEQFWTDRNVHPCPQDQLVLWEAPSLMDSDGYDADMRTLGCSIWIADYRFSLLNISLRWSSKWSYSRLCMELVHELGHSGGLAHSSDPHSIMNIETIVIPYDCTVWAKAQMSGQIRLYRAIQRHKKISRQDP